MAISSVKRIIVIKKNKKTFPKISQSNLIDWNELNTIQGNDIYKSIADTVLACGGSAFPTFIKIYAGII